MESEKKMDGWMESYRNGRKQIEFIFLSVILTESIQFIPRTQRSRSRMRATMVPSLILIQLEHRYKRLPLQYLFEIS
jgi:hypothetical protein